MDGTKHPYVDACLKFKLHLLKMDGTKHPHYEWLFKVNYIIQKWMVQSIQKWVVHQNMDVCLKRITSSENGWYKASELG